jgi:hypothetical protein
MAKRGMDINLLVSREPNYMGRSDAYEGGLGGFDLATGRAWQLEIPVELRHRKSQNFLEFLACLMQIVLLIKESNWSTGDCFLSIGDNISALGWIKKANFDCDDPEQATHISLAQTFMSIIMDNSIVLYSQWFAGIDNNVADTLSRCHDLSNTDLTNFIISQFPDQAPPGFHLSPLPPDLTSWALFWLRHNHATRELPPELQIRTIGGGSDTWNSYTIASYTMTSTCGDSRHMSDTTSLVPSCSAPEIVNGPNLPRDTITWLRNHAMPPSRLWVRPSCQLDTTTPARTLLEKLRSFYNVNSAGMRIMTPPKNHKKPSPSTQSDA